MNEIYGVIEEKRGVVNAATEGKTPGGAGDSVFDLFMSMSMND
jgi:hypothetical protein